MSGFKHDPRRTAGTKQNSLLSAVILCAGAGLGTSLALLLGFSWLYTKIDLPFWAAVPLATCAVSIGCFMSSLVLVRHTRKNGLFCGLCCGLTFFALYLAAVLISGQLDFSAVSSFKLVCFILSGCLGGFLSILLNEKKTRH